MSYISDNMNLRKTVEKLAPLPVTWGMASSWMLIADLMRRHPGELAPFEWSYPAGGTVWHLHERKSHLPWPQSHQEVLIQMVQWGHIHLHHKHPGGEMSCPVLGGMKSENKAMIRTVFPIFAPRLRNLVEAIEACLGLPGVEVTPVTTAATIGPRVISSALNLFLHTSRPLEVEGALFEGSRARQDLLSGFPQLAELANTIEGPVCEWENSVMPAATRDEICPIFFLQDIYDRWATGKSSTRIAVDVAKGIAFLPVSTLDLMHLYREHDRDIDRTAFTLITQARQEHRKSA